MYYFLNQILYSVQFFVQLGNIAKFHIFRFFKKDYVFLNDNTVMLCYVVCLSFKRQPLSLCSILFLYFLSMGACTSNLTPIRHTSPTLGLQYIFSIQYSFVFNFLWVFFPALCSVQCVNKQEQLKWACQSREQYIRSRVGNLSYKARTVLHLLLNLILILKIYFSFICLFIFTHVLYPFNYKWPCHIISWQPHFNQRIVIFLLQCLQQLKG